MKRKNLVWCNGEIIPGDQAPSGIFDFSHDYGGTIFDGVRLYSHLGKRFFFRLRDHVERALSGSRLLRMQIQFNADQLVQAHVDLADAHREYNYFRLRFWYGAPVQGESVGAESTIAGVDPTHCELHVAVVADNWTAYLSPDVYLSGAGLTISPWVRPFPNAGNAAAKGPGNYVTGQLAKMAASEHHFKRADGKMMPCAAAIMLTPDGFVSEMTGANVFVVKGGRVVTPPFSDCVLPGITRDSVIKLWAKKPAPVEIDRVPLMDLLTADEVVVTGTAAEASPIVWVGGYQIGDGRPGSFFRLARREFEEYFTYGVNSNLDPFKWLTFVE